MCTERHIHDTFPSGRADRHGVVGRLSTGVMEACGPKSVISAADAGADPLLVSSLRLGQLQDTHHYPASLPH